MRSSTTSNGWIWGVAAFVVATLPAPARSQGLAEQVDAVQDGVIRMSFAARTGVCGWGDGVRINSRSRDPGEWESACDPGPVRVAIHLREGRIIDIKAYVGGSWREANRVTDFGTVGASEAATYLLALSAGTAVDASKQAIYAASVADSAIVWPELARIGRDVARPTEVRQHAIFWMSQQEDVAVVAELADLLTATDDETIRDRAVFALSQHESDAALEQLLELAREEPDRELRKRAIFWLGQSRDPRAIALLTELITR